MPTENPFEALGRNPIINAAANQKLNDTAASETRHLRRSAHVLRQAAISILREKYPQMPEESLNIPDENYLIRFRQMSLSERSETYGPFQDVQGAMFFDYVIAVVRSKYNKDGQDAPLSHNPAILLRENRNRIATLLQYNIAGDGRVIPVLRQNAIQEALLNKAARDSILAEAASESPGMHNTRLCTELQQPIVGLELVYKDIQDMIGGDGDNDPCVDRNGENEGKSINSQLPRHSSHPLSLSPSLSPLPLPPPPTSHSLACCLLPLLQHPPLVPLSSPNPTPCRYRSRQCRRVPRRRRRRSRAARRSLRRWRS